ncbi:Non-essential glycogen phosphorylase [Sporothrix eucalyptigena]
MPRYDFTHPPTSRPAVVDESIKDIVVAVQVLWASPERMKAMEENLGPVGPILARYITRVRILGQMTAHGLERRFAACDSHTVQDILNPEPGHMRYFRGDVIEVLERFNNTWALGLSRGNVGLFPLEHTRSDNFYVVLTSYTAKNAVEISVNKGQVVPTTAATVPGWCEAYALKEHGLVPRENLMPLRTPPAEERDQNAQLYYRYAPLERGHIRLIWITPENVKEFEASGKQSLFITLVDKPLSRAPAYTAFSYCWGDPADVTPVFCDGKLLYVPSSLWRLLSWHMPGGDTNVYSQLDVTRVNRTQEAAIFWADAICINQRDTLEKNRQIPLMQSIYQRATSVMAYVGECDGNAMVAGLSIEMIAGARQSYRSLGAAHRDEPYDPGKVDWEAVKGFFSQPLFGRCWVIQEIVLSREITFCYGNMRILMSRIHDCSLALAENHVRPPNSMLGDTYGRQVADSEKFNESLRQLLNLSRFKTVWDQGGILPFIDVLQRFRSAQATDPRDKVYALLGVAPEEYRRSIIPDYSASNTAVAVYEHVARCALQLGDIAELLPNAGISRKNPALASWAPDWSYEPREALKGSLFSCSGSTVFGSAYVSSYPHHNHSKLDIRGSIIDKVWRAGPRWCPHTTCELPDVPIMKAAGNAPVAFFLADAFMRLASSAAEARGELYPSGDSIPRAVWQTLVCGMMRGEHRTVAGDEVHYDAFLECIEDAWKSERPVLFRGIGGHRVEPQTGGGDDDDDDDLSAKLEKISLDFGLGSLDPPQGPRAALAANSAAGGAAGAGTGSRSGSGSGATGPSQATSARDERKRRKAELEERAMPFLKALVRAQAGRRTCVTEKAYFAAVPDEAREGDEIAVFFGHPLPYVVRRAGGPDANGREQFRLVGHCYVHGIMDGELADPNPTKDAAMRGFDAIDLALL